MRKGGALRGKKEVFALYMLQSKRFSSSRKLMENGAPKGILNRPTSITLEPSGQIFEILGRFFKCERIANLGVGKIQ